MTEANNNSRRTSLDRVTDKSWQPWYRNPLVSILVVFLLLLIILGILASQCRPEDGVISPPTQTPSTSDELANQVSDFANTAEADVLCEKVDNRFNVTVKNKTQKSNDFFIAVELVSGSISTASTLDFLNLGIDEVTTKSIDIQTSTSPQTCTIKAIQLDRRIIISND